MSDDRLVAASPRGEDEFDQHLRPQVLEEFIGQRQAKANLRVFIEAARQRGEAGEADWERRMAAYAEECPDLAGELRRRLDGDLPEGWENAADAAIQRIAGEAADMATRKASLVALNAFAPALPELAGGSADLTGSNLTLHNGSTVITEAARGWRSISDISPKYSPGPWWLSTASRPSSPLRNTFTRPDKMT